MRTTKTLATTTSRTSRTRHTSFGLTWPPWTMIPERGIRPSQSSRLSLWQRTARYSRPRLASAERGTWPGLGPARLKWNCITSSRFAVVQLLMSQ